MTEAEDYKIHYQNYDVGFKESLTIFQNQTLDFLGVYLPKIIDVTSTEIAKIETKNAFIDMNFLLADGSILHLEEEKQISEDDLIRFAQTDLWLYTQKKRIIHTVVLSLTEEDTRQSFDIGSMHYHVQLVNIAAMDGTQRLQEIKVRVLRAEAINDLELVFLPLMKHARERVEILKEAIALTKQLPKSDHEKQKMIAIELVLMDKYITKETMNELWEGLMMLNFIRFAEEKGRETGKEELLWKLIVKKFPKISTTYYEKIKTLGLEKLDNVGLEIIEMKDQAELDRFF